MRLFYFFYILIFTFQFSFSQNWKLSFTSKVEENGVGCNSAEISLFKNNAFSEKKTTGIDGRFTFTLEPNGDYRIEITKPGYVKKMFAVITRGVPEDVNQDFAPIDLKAVVLFEPLKECDLSALSKPLLRFSYDPNTKDFEYDKNEFDLAQEALAQISECEKMAVATAKKFAKLMQEGRNLIAKKDCKNASLKFTQALELKPNNEEATKALKESDDICSGHAQNDLNYKQTMDSASSSVTNKNYEIAIAQYQRALNIKPGEKEPPKKIEEVRSLIKTAENEKAFNQLMKEANAEYDLKNYEKAIELFTKAKELNASHPEPPRKIADIKLLMGATAKYELAMKNGTKQKEEKKWDEAIKFYTEALSAKKDDALAKQKIEECNNEKSKENQGKQQESDFLSAMKKGKKALSDKLWDEAISSFNQALTLKKDDEEAKIKLKEAEDGKKFSESGIKSNELYLAAMKKGDDAMASKNYSMAVTFFSEALAIKKDDSAAKKKLQEAKDALNGYQISKENLEKYNQAMKNGLNNLNDKKWSEAIINFTDALKFKKDDPEAKNKIKEAEEAIKANEKGLKSDELYSSAMKNGKEALTNKKFAVAIDEFNKALKYKNEDIEAKNKLAEAEAGRDAEEKYKENMKLGRLYFKEKKWSQAIAIFNEVLSFKSDEAEAKEKLKEAEEALKKETDNNKIEELYKSAMKFGNDALNGKKYNDAIAAYTSALGYKKDDKEAKKKLEEARADLKVEEQNKNLDSKYLEAMSKGKIHLSGNSWDSAILSFKTALEIKKNDSEASRLLSEAQKALENEKKSKETNLGFEKLMKEGKNEMSTSKWVQAVKCFNLALEIKPNDPEALKAINDAEEKIKEESLQKTFDNLISKGDSCVELKNFDIAMEKYVNAKALNRNSNKVGDKIEKLKKLIEADKQAKAKETEYHAAMKEGEDLEVAGNWTKAIQTYETKALIIKPSDKDALQRIEECKKAINNKTFADSVSNREKNILEKYNLTITEARKLFKNKDYKNSLKKYEEAQKIRIDEIEPTNKIYELKLLISKLEEEELKSKNQKQIDENFNAAIEQAKKLSSEKKYVAAKEKYRSAQLLKPTNSVPPAEIKKLDELIKNQEKTNNNINEIKYNSAMSAGDNKFTSKNYQQAISFYGEALKFKPNDSIATKKIRDTESLLKINTSNTTSTVDSKYSSYKQGVTHLKREITQNFVSSKSVVKRGNIVMVYEKREFNWGVIFYRDDEPISGSQYESGIRD